MIYPKGTKLRVTLDAEVDENGVCLVKVPTGPGATHGVGVRPAELFHLEQQVIEMPPPPPIREGQLYKDGNGALYIGSEYGGQVIGTDGSFHGGPARSLPKILVEVKA